jgi:hypothetical protein
MYDEPTGLHGRYTLAEPLPRLFLTRGLLLVHRSGRQAVDLAAAFFKLQVCWPPSSNVCNQPLSAALRQEPDAATPLVRICGGGYGQP